MDTLTTAQRSERMSRVRSADTRPELRVRHVAHALGYRYRLHKRDVPGKPDLVFAKRRKVIFVHGCFWHRHNCAAGQRTPKSRLSFWLRKFARNQSRDREVMRLLRKSDWKAMTVWECETKDAAKLVKVLKAFLDD
jgi:DNA mismatch endonuclease, patch repair protein